MRLISITEPNILVLFKEIIVVYAEIHKTHKYNLQEKRIFFHVKAYSVYGYYCVLMFKVIQLLTANKYFVVHNQVFL